MADRRTILLTGANRGLGLATAKALARAGHRLLITARSEAKAAQALAEVERAAGPRTRSEGHEALVLDLASFASVRRLAADLRARAESDPPLRVDLLHHNAGVILPPEQRTLTEDGVELTLQINAVAPLLLTCELLPVLARPGRITAAGSGLHMPGSRGPEVDFRFDDPMLERGYHPELAYKNSKLALLWVMRELDRLLAPRALRCDVICPGFVPETPAEHFRGLRRFMFRHVLARMPFATSLEDSVANMVRLLGELMPDVGPDGLPERGGRYYSHWQPSEPSPDALDDDKARRFWALACEWTGLELG